MRPLLPPAFDLSRRFRSHLEKLFRPQEVRIGVVTTHRPDGSWNWESRIVWPEFDQSDFPPRQSAHYRVLVRGKNFPSNPNDFTTAAALVIGEQEENGRRIFLLQLQTVIEPNPLRSEAILS